MLAVVVGGLELARRKLENNREAAARHLDQAMEGAGRAAALLRAAGRPLLSTSCNRSGDEPCRSADEVERAFGAELCVAGGEPAGGALPSTVVAVDAGGALELLREGAIPFAELRAQETR